MGLLEVRQLTKKFAQHDVLSGISFTVSDGEFLVLLGPSGGGKSTLLKILCGIEKADSGQVTLAGRDITTLPPRERNVGMVFQDYGLYPHMNVFENIAYGLEARNYPKDEIAKRVQEAAGRLGLTPLIERIIVDLSGGEQQRVALARALAKDADFYLFDEPISNLDPKLRAQARRDILMVHRVKQKPTVYVTHDQNEALAIADRIAIIANGKLQQVGTADELITTPANVFIAGFLGTPAMNLFPAEVEQDTVTGSYRVRFAAGSVLSLPAHWNAALKEYGKSKVILGIPPTAFLPGTAAGTDTHLEGKIDFVEPLVSEVIVSFTLPGGLFASIIFQNVDETQLTVGATMSLDIAGDQLCLFDPDTELALSRGG